MSAIRSGLVTTQMNSRYSVEVSDDATGSGSTNRELVPVKLVVRYPIDHPKSPSCTCGFMSLPTNALKRSYSSSAARPLEHPIRRVSGHAGA